MGKVPIYQLVQPVIRVNMVAVRALDMDVLDSRQETVLRA